MGRFKVEDTFEEQRQAKTQKDKCILVEIDILQEIEAKIVMHAVKFDLSSSN